MRLILLISCFPILLLAQFQDDFSDNNLALHWEGEREKFIVNATQELQLRDANSASSAVLFTRLPLMNSTVWEFYFRQEFSPSTSNFARIFLASDSENLTENGWNGYFLKLGGISGSEDALELIRRTNGQNEVLIVGTNGALGGSVNQARVRVIRDDLGNWTLSTDYTGGTDFQVEGTATDNTYPSSSIFGLMCTYTTSRSENFFFDDFSVSSTFEDSNAPSLVEIKVENARNIRLEFDEAIDANSAADLSNFRLTPSVDVLNADVNASKITLTLAEDLRENIPYTLVVENLEDLNGNRMNSISFELRYDPPTIADFGDIIINEIFADPTPPIALPEGEYVELYNRSDKKFNLKDFIIADASEEIDLPDYDFPAKSYLLLHDVEIDFSAYPNALGLSNFLGLGNAGDILSLISPQGDVIDILAYTRDWYQDSEKSQGGWSLERNNPNLVCDNSSANWQASIDLRGGTPGQENSLLEDVEDDSFAGVSGAILIEADRLRVSFHEALNEVRAEDINNYQIDEFEIISATLETPLNNSVLLRLDVPAIKGQIYNLRIEKTLTDCLGIEADEEMSILFALPEQAEVGELRINEILFNPQSGGSDFVEFYNRSDRVLALNGLFLANRRAGTLENIKPLELNQPIFPNTYFVLSPDIADIENRYFTQFPARMANFPLPTLADKEGSLVLYRLENEEAIVIDEVSYLDDWHSPLLDDENGVSLERINPDLPSNISSSWQSAATSVGFASPTYQNSQFFDPSTNQQEQIFSLSEDSFSPNGDGFQDFLTISYAADQVGYLATVSIFDAQGRLVTQLAENELLASSGIFKWDGTNNNGTLARLGIYIVHIEYFTPAGNAARFQATFALTGQLD